MGDKKIISEKLSETVSIAILTIAVPYLTGFFYLSSYYQYFSISMTELGISEPEVYSASFVVVWKMVLRLIELSYSRFVIVPVLFGCLAMIPLFLYLGPDRRKISLRYLASIFNLLKGRRASSLLSLALISLMGFPIIGSVFGERSANADLGNLPPVMVVDLDSGINHIGSLDTVLDRQLLNFPMDRLIFANESSYFLLRIEAGSSPSTIRLQRHSRYLSIVPIIVE